MYHYKDPFNKKERNKRGENLKCEVSEAAIVNIVQVFRVSKPAAKDETPQTASRVPWKCRTRNEQYERNNWIRYGKFTYISPKFMVNGSYGKETPDCFDIGNTDYTTQLYGDYTTKKHKDPQKTASISWKVRPMFFFVAQII